MLRKSLAVFFAVAVAATANSSVQLQRGKPDGYKTVARAQWLGSSGKLEEGRAFIAELRVRPIEGRTVEEIQAVDMAEFALLRSSIETEKKRCIECLKSVYDTNCTSFWGWAAYTFLKELGEEWRKVGDAATVAGDLRVDLRKDSPTANFVKVGFEPGGGKKPLSLSKILVYGNKQY